MNRLLTAFSVLLMGMPAAAQTKPASTTSTSVISVIEDITAKRFLPDTVFTALSEEDKTLLVKEPVANWGLAQESGEMIYYNLVVGTRSYQLIIIKPPKDEFPKATLLRFATPKSKPEPIARGTLRPKVEQAPK